MGWLMCDGSLQPISEYDALFNLIGTTFTLPDLRGRVPLHCGAEFIFRVVFCCQVKTCRSTF